MVNMQQLDKRLKAVEKIVKALIAFKVAFTGEED